MGEFATTNRSNIPFSYPPTRLFLYARLVLPSFPTESGGLSVFPMRRWHVSIASNFSTDLIYSRADGGSGITRTLVLSLWRRVRVSLIEDNSLLAVKLIAGLEDELGSLQAELRSIRGVMKIDDRNRQEYPRLWYVPLVKRDSSRSTPTGSGENRRGDRR